MEAEEGRIPFRGRCLPDSLGIQTGGRGLVVENIALTGHGPHAESPHSFARGLFVLWACIEKERKKGEGGEKATGKGKETERRSRRRRLRRGAHTGPAARPAQTLRAPHFFSPSPRARTCARHLLHPSRALPVALFAPREVCLSHESRLAKGKFQRFLPISLSSSSGGPRTPDGGAQPAGSSSSSSLRA